MTTISALQPLQVPLSGTHLIEASAGTGKTYTIAALYLRLVLGHGGENGFGRSLSPPEILVMTFTNAATEELRHRIRNRLTEAAAFFRGQGDADALLHDLRAQSAPEDRHSLARLLDQAAQWMDESAIYTIHGWCRRMLSQHAFDSGSLFDVELAADERDLLEEAACDYWRAHFYPLDRAAVAEIQGLLRCKTPQELLTEALPLMGSLGEAPPSPSALLAKRHEIIDRAREPWQAHWDTAVGLIRAARADKTLNGNKYRAASLEKWLGQMRDWVFDAGALPDDKSLEKLSARGLAAGAAKNRRAPRHEAFSALDRLGDALAELNMAAALIHHAAYGIAHRVQKEKERRARMGFDDLLTRMGEALAGPGGACLAAGLRKQFPVALIDEFQDTDPVQYDIFRAVYREQPGTGLFMIGDPKQAIYAFRGADIHTYLSARRDTAGRRHTLATNYRSTAEMVTAVNQLFATALDYPDGPFLFKDRIAFAPMMARGRDETLVVQDRPVCAMTLWQLSQDGPISKNGPQGYLPRMAEATASEIARLLNLAQETPSTAGFRASDGALTPLHPDDIAILVRDATEARVMRQALAHRGIRSVYLSDRASVFDSPEAGDLLYILQACAEPERGRRLKAALATATLALPLEQLERYCRDETIWEAEGERFRELRRIWRYRGVLPMLRALFQAFDVPGRRLAAEGGERCLTNLLHLAEILQAAATRLDGESALIRWLAEKIRNPAGADDEAILRLESDAALIRVITLHKSKGLEYPLVFLPFICGFRAVNAKNTPVAQYHDAVGHLCQVPFPADEDLAAADRERLAEELRMLYVAVTRSRHACWLGIAVLGKTTAQRGEESLLHQSALGYLLGGGDPIPTATLNDLLIARIGGCPAMALSAPPEGDPTAYRPRIDAPHREAAREFSGKVPRHWRITSYSGILEGSELVASRPAPGTAPATGLTMASGESDPKAPDTPLEDRLREVFIEPAAFPEMRPAAHTIDHFPRGAQPGTFLHGLLEWAAREGFSRVSQERDLLQEKLQAELFWHGWQEWKEMLTEWLPRLLSTPLPLPAGLGRMPLSSLASERCQAEMEFLFEARHVSVQHLDAAVKGAVMPDAPRPALNDARVNGMLKGFIDLVFCHEERYFILDYKSNHLGDAPAAYTQPAMEAAMRDHRYDLQYVLYTLALHRLLKARLVAYDYERHMGGALYLFLRGVDETGRGVYGDRPPRALIEQLDARFAGKAPIHGI